MRYGVRYPDGECGSPLLAAPDTTISPPAVTPRAARVMHQPRLPTTAELVVLWRSGRTMREIAERFGVTAQAVGGRIKRAATPGDRAANRRARQAARQRRHLAEQAAAIHAAREAGRVCALPWCDGVVLGSPRRRTCSPECAAEWSVVRRYIDADQYARHRRAQGLGEATRRHRIPGSEADRILKAHGL